MTRALLSVCLAASLLLVAGVAWGQRPNWYKSVYDHLAAGDCGRAADALQEDLRQPDGPVLLLAGWLSQWGHCVQRSADNAWAFYERAHAAGETSAALRLAGLAATKSGGSDVAAVLWWARRATGERQVKMGACDPFPGEAGVQEAAFLGALRTWAQDRLLRCRNEIGYRALVVAEVLYPVGAGRKLAEGVIRLSYDLQEGTVRVVPVSKAVSEDLIRHVEAVAMRSMQDMPRSPVSLTGDIEFAFQLR